MLSGPPTEIHHQFLGLTDVQREVVVVAPLLCRLIHRRR